MAVAAMVTTTPSTLEERRATQVGKGLAKRRVVHKR